MKGTVSQARQQLLDSEDEERVLPWEILHSLQKDHNSASDPDFSPVRPILDFCSSELLGDSWVEGAVSADATAAPGNWCIVLSFKTPSRPKLWQCELHLTSSYLHLLIKFFSKRRIFLSL